MKIIRIISICLTFWFALLSGYAQRPDADTWFLKAREAAFSDQWAEARKICREILSYYPNYNDATLLMGRTYAWELKTDSARMCIRPLLDIEPDNVEVLNLLTDNEIWGSQYHNALNWINNALDFYPSNEEFLFKKANVHYALKDNTNAIKVLNKLLIINPTHNEGNELLNTILPSDKYIVELYGKAEEEAHAGNWKSVRKYCHQALKEDPDFFSASLLLAQALAFSNKFDSARIVSKELYKALPDQYDVLDLMVDIEIWNRKYTAAMAQVEKALIAYPDDENFLFKKAKIQYLSKEYEEALKTLDELFAINPDHKEGNELKNDILQNHRYRDYVFVEDYFEYFKEPYLSRKFIVSTGISKWTKHGRYIGRVNIGEEAPWPTPAIQYEGEAYQQLFPTNYLFLDYAYSRNWFFPEHRGAIEFFQRLPKGFEASLGVRFLYWYDLAWIYTGSVSWLKNKNYLAFRPFFCQKNSHWSNSYHLTYRRYFSDKEDYAFAILGYGSYSDEFLQLNPNMGKSYMAQIGILKFLTDRWFFLTSLGYARDTRDAFVDNIGIKHPSENFNRFQASVGVRYYFNMFK